MKKYNFICLAATMLLSACGGGGGGSSSSSNTNGIGYFIDDPVSGLSYSCGTGSDKLSGITSDTGSFSYLSGQSCTFKVGNVTLGTIASVPSDGKVTPQDVAGVTRSATSEPTALAIAQFLQSLHDGSSDAKIVITEATRTKMLQSTAVTLAQETGSPSQDELSNLVSFAGSTLKSASTAQTALDKQISNGTISKTVGTVSSSSPVLLKSISITSEIASKAAGFTKQFKATGYYSDGNTKDLSSQVTWLSDDLNILTLNTDGLATLIKKGDSKISASYQGNNAKLIVGAMKETVLEPTSVNIVISYVISGITSIQNLASTTLQALVTLSDNTTKLVTAAATWAVSNLTDSGNATLVANQDANTATITGTAPGSITLSAAYSGLLSNSLILNITGSTVSGKVTGLKGAIVVNNGQGGSLAVATSGSFIFPTPLISGSTYNITISTNPSGQTCSVTSGSGVIGMVNISNITIDCVDNLGSITGTAAVGVPLKAATVLLRDVNGIEKTTVTSANGSIQSIDLSTLTAPVMLRATGNFGGNTATVHSVIFSGNTVNITPFTDAALLIATGKSPAALFKDPSLWAANLTKEKISSAQNDLRNYLSNYFTALGIDSKYDFFSDVFSADGSSIDALGDYLRVIIKTDGSGLTIQDKLSNDNKLVIVTGVANSNKLSAPTYTVNLLKRANTILAKYSDFFSGTSGECVKRWSAMQDGLILGKYKGMTLSQTINLGCVLNWSVTAGIVYSDPIIKFCNGDTNPLTRCFVQQTTTRSNGVISTSDAQMDLSSDTTTVTTGTSQNTSPFWAAVSPAIEKFIMIDRSYLPDPYDTNLRLDAKEKIVPGLLVFINASGYSDTRNPSDGTTAPLVIKSAKIYAGNSNTGVELGKLNLYAGRTGALLRDTNTQIYMSSILPLTTDQISAIRTAKGKVTIYTYSDYEYTNFYQSGTYFISSPYPTDDQIANAQFAKLNKLSIDYLKTAVATDPSGVVEKLTVLPGAPTPNNAYFRTNIKSFSKTDNEGGGVIEFLPNPQYGGAPGGANLFINNPQIDIQDINAVIYRTRYVRCGTDNLNNLGCAPSYR